MFNFTTSRSRSQFDRTNWIVISKLLITRFGNTSIAIRWYISTLLINASHWEVLRIWSEVLIQNSSWAEAHSEMNFPCSYLRPKRCTDKRWTIISGSLLADSLFNSLDCNSQQTAKTVGDPKVTKVRFLLKITSIKFHDETSTVYDHLQVEDFSLICSTIRIC